VTKPLDELTRPWEIWLVHHTHVDIGYTEPQDVILRKHAEFVAQALDYCTATDALPAGERFCWTCEVAWSVKAFLARYPERANEFFRRVREGRIEVTALYLQLTDLFTQELLEETTDYALNLGREHDFEVVTAMNDDVNGWSWGLPDLLSSRGIRYFDSAINETRALGVRPRPAMFRWTGPRGGSVLFWHSNGYLFGNAIGAAYVFGGGLGLDQPGQEERIGKFLKGLEEGGYPHHVVEVRVHGADHDNAPPALWINDAVRRWNAAHPAGPRLRLVTPRTWFDEAAAQWPVPVVEHKAGWPDWWADGNASAAAESALVRQAQADLITLQSLAAATGAAPPPDRIERAREAAAFFCEHTWGAYCSTESPDSLTTKAQWNTKAGFAYTAAVEAGSLVKDALTAEVRKRATGTPGILVFNPSDHARSGLLELAVADEDLGLGAYTYWMLPTRTEPGPAFHLVDEETGAATAVWREPTLTFPRRLSQLMRFMARDIPPRGFRRYRVVAGESPVVAATESPIAIKTGERGITALHDRNSDTVWMASDGGYALGEVVYEAIPGPFGRDKLCGMDGIRRDCPLARTSLRFGAPEALSFPYGSGMRLTAHDLPGSLRALTLEIVAYADVPRVDLIYRVEKMPNNEAEALYVAFPLCSPSTVHCSLPTVFLDLPGAVMRPGLDQMPGTATDWHSLQHYFAVEDGGRTVVVASPDIPLVQVNGINTGKWQETLPPHNGLVMSWVMNNYWFTNFPAAQGGGFTWRYSLQAFPGAFDPKAADRFARGVRQPLLAEVMR
jgi:hypothetical protein